MENSMQSEKNNVMIEQIRSLLNPYKLGAGIFIPFNERDVFCENIYNVTSVQLGFNNSPLSVVETLCLGLATICSYAEVSYVLGLTKPEILSHERRAKNKLYVDSKIQAVCVAVQFKYINLGQTL